MEGRRLKKSVIYGLYFMGLLLVFGSIYLVGVNSSQSYKSEEEPLKYVSKSIFDSTISVVAPVVNTEEKVGKPYTSDKVEMNKTYYDYEDESTMEKGIIYYQNTYMQSSGVFYTSNEKFDVISVLKGTVTAVSEDDLLGKVVQITHENGLVSVYENVDNIKVKVNDVVEKGAMIATSGKSNLFKEVENGLYFEMVSDTKNINPNLCFDRTISEIKG